MPFKEQSIMDQRIEFVMLAKQKSTSFSKLCKRFNISRRTGYKWISRYDSEGYSGLIDQSRRPKNSPNKTPEAIERHVVKLRKADPEWGAKKLNVILKREQQQGIYPFQDVPCKTTINKILQRNGLIKPECSDQLKKPISFEYDYPNELWQMDFKGHFSMLNKAACYPLTITDDHSRYNICLQACQDQKETTVKGALIDVFRKYGLPNKILTDNGPPWGSIWDSINGHKAFTKLEKWLIQLNINLIHGRPYHPQTQGKEERFHRTLKQELLNYEQFKNHDHCQLKFNNWREKYNYIRPHESLDFKVPIDRYQPSTKEYPEEIKPYQYNLYDEKRKVNHGGILNFQGKTFRIGKAFTGEYIAVRRTTKENKYEVYFCNRMIRELYL